MSKFVKGTRATRKPKATNVAGRTWDRVSVIVADGEKVAGLLDTTWGRNAYFECAGKWYAIPTDYQRSANCFDARPDSWQLAADEFSLPVFIGHD